MKRARNNPRSCHATKQEEKAMSKKNIKIKDKIEVKNGVKYIVRYINGIPVARISYDEFMSHVRIRQL